MAEVAHGEVNIEARDQATAEMHRIEAEYKAAMARIDRMEASAKVTADTREIDTKLARARDDVRRLEGERATVTIKAEKKALDAALKEARAEVKRLDGEKATIQIETRGTEKTLAAIEAVKRAEASRAAAEERYARQRGAASRNAGVLARKAELDTARERVEVDRLTAKWIAQSKVVERLARQRPPILGREARAEFDHFQQEARNKLNLIEAGLRNLGHKAPPLHMRVDDSWRARAKFAIQDFVNNAQQKFSQIGKVRLNLGPFSGTLRTMAVATATLAPILTSLLGSATALVGVLGTGLAGATAVAAGGFAGMALNLGGVIGAIRPAITGFKLAQQATTNYHKAVDKYGAGSKQAKTAQQQMNSVLSQVDPNARKAAKGLANTSAEWHKLTGPAAKKAVGDVLVGGIKTLNALMPTLAHNTNQTLGILDTKLTGIQGKLRSPGAIRIFDSLGKSANTFLGPALDGLTHLGAAFGHVAESAARIFAGPAGSGFSKWAANIDKATQPGAKLDATIKRLGTHAADLLHFFAALGRLMMTVLNGGANSGDRLVKSMTAALTRWNDFLKTSRGQRSMADFFKRSEENVRALWSVLAPLVAAFVQWSSLLAPFTTGLLKGVTFVANLVAGFTKLIGLGGPVAALGATIGAVFAVAKLGAFLNMLVRIGGAMRALGAAGSLKAILTGNLRAFTGGGAMAQGGAAAGAEIRAAMAQGGAAAAAEIRSAMVSGGAAAGAEEAAAIRTAGAAAGAEQAVGGAAGGAAAGGLAGRALAALGGGEAVAGAAASAAAFGSEGAALAALGATAAAVAIPIAALGVGLFFVNKAIQGGTPKIQTWFKNVAENIITTKNAHDMYGRLQGSIADVGSAYAHSRLDLKSATDQLHATKKGTMEHQQALLAYRDALRQNMTDRQAYEKQAKGLQISANTELIGLRHQRQTLIDLGKSGKDLAAVNAAIERAQNKSAAATDVAARAYQGMVPLTDQATQAVGRLARQAGGGPIAKKISLKFETSGDVQSVARKATSAIQAGVPSRQVMRIVADSSNAEQAIRRLNALTLKRKQLELTAVDHATNAIRTVLRNLGLLPSKHDTNVNTRDNSTPVINPIKRLLNSLPGSHNTNVNARDNASHPAHNAKNALQGIPGFVQSVIRAVDQATAVAQAVKSALSAIHDVTFTIFGKHAGATHAEGGVETPQTKSARRVVNRAQARGAKRTQGGRYDQPTFLVGEEDRSEYVIATNPEYRRSNIGYLAAAANELGYMITPAARGRAAKKRPAQGQHPTHPTRAADPNTPGIPGTRGALAGLGVPDPYTVGAVPVEDVDADVTKLDTALQNQQQLVTTLTTQLKGMHVPGAHKDKHGHVTNQAAINAAKRRRKDVQTHLNAARAGGQWRNLTYRSIKDLTKEDHQAHTDLGAIQTFNSSVAHWNSRIASDRQDMDTASGRYQRTGDGKYKTAWTTARDDRVSAIHNVKGLLRGALEAAERIDSRFHTLNLGAYVDQLRGDLSGADSAEEDTTTATVSPDAAAPTLESVIKGYGMSDRLANLTMGYALSQVNDVPDNPATPYVDEHAASLGDNLSAAEGLKSFYSDVLARAQAAGEPADIITAAANEFVSARDTFQGISDTINQGAQQAQQNKVNDVINFSTAREALYTQFGSNYSPVGIGTTTPAPGYALQPAPAPGAYGPNTAAPGTTQTVTVNNTFPTPPPDPHTWSQGVAWELQAAL